MLDKVYVESSIISYLISKPSNDIIISSHQLQTKDWWENSKKDYELYCSKPMIFEISQGNKQYARERLELIKDLKILPTSNELNKLVEMYMRHFKLSKKLELDITHIAYSIHYKMDYLLTWNCKHIANAHFKVQLTKFNKKNNIIMPEICTPEELDKKWRK